MSVTLFKYGGIRRGPRSKIYTAGENSSGGGVTFPGTGQVMLWKDITPSKLRGTYSLPGELMVNPNTTYKFSAYGTVLSPDTLADGEGYDFRLRVGGATLCELNNICILNGAGGGTTGALYQWKVEAEWRYLPATNEYYGTSRFEAFPNRGTSTDPYTTWDAVNLKTGSEIYTVTPTPDVGTTDTYTIVPEFQTTRSFVSPAFILVVRSQEFSATGFVDV